MNIVLIEKGEKFFLFPDKRFQHIKNVLKLREGDSFKAGVINGESGEAVITELSEKELRFAFKGREENPSLYPLTLIIAQIRPICMKRVIREAVSLGVSKMVLTVTDLGEKSYLSSSLYNTGEYLDVAKSGAEQSGKTGLGKIIIAENLEQALEGITEEEKILMDTCESPRLSSFGLKGKSVALAIGGERGWTDRERELFSSSSFITSSLGDRILRSETAVVAAAAIALSKMGI